jgi:hypothetical protein
VERPFPIVPFKELLMDNPFIGVMPRLIPPSPCLFMLLLVIRLARAIGFTGAN